MKRTFIGFVALLLGVLTFWLLYRADRDGVVPDAAKLLIGAPGVPLGERGSLAVIVGKHGGVGSDTH